MNKHSYYAFQVYPDSTSVYYHYINEKLVGRFINGKSHSVDDAVAWVNEIEFLDQRDIIKTKLTKTKFYDELFFAGLKSK